MKKSSLLLSLAMFATLTASESRDSKKCKIDDALVQSKESGSYNSNTENEDIILPKDFFLAIVTQFALEPIKDIDFKTIQKILMTHKGLSTFVIFKFIIFTREKEQVLKRNSIATALDLYYAIGSENKLVERKNLLAFKEVIKNKKLQLDPQLQGAIDSGNIQNIRDTFAALNTALCTAILEEKDIELIAKIINEGADANFQGKDPAPLMVAARKGNITLVELLLSNGADINMIGHMSAKTPLRFALSSGNVDLISLLLNKGADVNLDERRPVVYKAVEMRNKTIVEILIDAGADVNAIDDPENSTALMELSCTEHSDAMDIELFKILLQAGADLNVQNEEWDTTALSLAVDFNNIHFVVSLLRAGANPNIKSYYDEFGTHQTPIMNAIGKGYVSLVQILRVAGADIDFDTIDKDPVLKAQMSPEMRALLESFKKWQ